MTGNVVLALATLANLHSTKADVVVVYPWLIRQKMLSWNARMVPICFIVLPKYQLVPVVAVEILQLLHRSRSQRNHNYNPVSKYSSFYYINQGFNTYHQILLFYWNIVIKVCFNSDRPYWKCFAIVLNKSNRFKICSLLPLLLWEESSSMYQSKIKQIKEISWSEVYHRIWHRIHKLYLKASIIHTGWS